MTASLREHEVLGLIGGIYAAAEEPQLWGELLTQLSDALRGTTVALVFEDLTHRGASIGAAVRMAPEHVRRYEEYYAAHNVWMEAAAPFARPGTIVTSQGLLRDAELVKTEYYADFLLPLKARHLLGTCIFRDKGALAQCSFLRTGRRGGFGKAEVELLTVLTPHLQRALRLHQRLSGLREEGGAVRDALDRTDFGIILVDARARPIVVNRVGSEILAARDGLSSHREEIIAADSAENGKLHRLIADAVAVGSGRGLESGGALAVSRPSLRRSYSVVVTPLRARESAFGQAGAMAAIFITDPERTPRSDPELLRQLFGFTPAEARMAALMLGGESVEEAAEHLSITLNTARTHVRHLHEKTDTKRQGDFIRILALSRVARETGKA